MLKLVKVSRTEIGMMNVDLNLNGMGLGLENLVVNKCRLTLGNVTATCRIWFLARDVIYTSRAYATMSVSVCL